MGNGTKTISVDGEMNLDKTLDHQCEHTLPGGVRSGSGGNLSTTSAGAREIGDFSFASDSPQWDAWDDTSEHSLASGTNSCGCC
jgi:hypothetical protein